MNYRHGFHAGNAVDVVKHVVLVALLQALQRKPAPYAYLETHAGRGRYALESGDATRTGEADAGIQRLRAARPRGLPVIDAYLALVDAENHGVAPSAPARRYPGSPAIALAMAREGDRALLCESQAEEAAVLRAATRGAARVEVREGDGWAMLPAALPPPERRGLVLIDPPFEQADDWRRASDALLTALGRWPNGTVAVWYPIKATAETAAFARRVAAGSPAKVYRIEARFRPDGPGLLGCGLVVANPPFGLGEVVAPELHALVDILAAGRGGTTLDWLVPERD